MVRSQRRPSLPPVRRAAFASNLPARARLGATVTTIAVLAGILAGCTSGSGIESPELPEPVDLCALAAPAGETIATITVGGAVGAPADVTFDSALTVTGVERAVVVEGDGAKLDGTSLVTYAMTVFDAATGAEVGSQGYDSEPTLPVPAASLGQYLGCVPVGSRVVVTVPATDADVASVRVFDVLDAVAGAADGKPQKPVEGMPAVALDESGAPTVGIPSAQPPSQTRVAVLKEGEGPIVAPGDSVLLQYSGVRWSDGSVFDSTWAQGAPTVIVTTDAIAGFKEAIEGRTVGSQVLVVIPPGSAYGEGEINENDLTGETLVFVLDLLAATPAA